MNGTGFEPFGPSPAIQDRGNAASSAGGIETLDRYGLSYLAGVSGQLWVSYVTAETSGLIDRLMIGTGDTAGVSITLARLVLFTAAADGSIVKVAQTANDTTIGAAAFTPYERVFATAGGWPAPYQIVRGRRYGIGFLQVAGTPSNIQGKSVLDGATPPVGSRFITGQSDVASSYAVGALTAHYVMAYMRGRPG